MRQLHLFMFAFCLYVCDLCVCCVFMFMLDDECCVCVCVCVSHDSTEARYLWSLRAYLDLAQIYIVWIGVLLLGPEHGVLLAIAVTLLQVMYSSARPNVVALGYVLGVHLCECVSVSVSVCVCVCLCVCVCTS